MANPSEEVFRVLVADQGVDALDISFSSAEKALADRYSGVQFTDEEDILSRFTISVGVEFVNFAHVGAEHEDVYVLTLADTKRIVEDMRRA